MNKYNIILGLATVAGMASFGTLSGHADTTSTGPSSSQVEQSTSDAGTSSVTEPSTSAPTTPSTPAVTDPSTPATTAPSSPAKPTAPSAPSTTAPSTSAPVEGSSYSYDTNSGAAAYDASTQVDTTSVVSDYYGETNVFNVSGYNVPQLTSVNDSDVQAFINSISSRVSQVAGENNLYASVIIAQAILESGHGTSTIATDDHNLFNITGSYNGKSVNTSVGTFRSYDTYDQSLIDYINLMLHGTTYNKFLYAGTWKSVNPNYSDAVKSMNGVFAEDPNYVNKVLSIIKEYNLTKYDDMKSIPAKYKVSNPESPLVGTSMDSAYPVWDGVQHAGADSYAWGNCTEYVYNRITQLGGHIGQFMGNGGQWGATAAAQGYYVTSHPSKGYAVSFPAGVAGASSEYGHVAFVEKVYHDGSILISEMNATAGLGKVDYRIISASDASLLTYIQPK